MTVQPLGSRVLVKITEAEEKTAGGIFIPATAQEKTQEGIIVSIGNLDDGVDLKVNDKIIYDKYAGTSLTINSEDHLILKTDDILAKIT